MATIEEIAAQLELQLHDATAKIDDFVTQQTAHLQKATQDHEHIMRDMEAKVQRLFAEETAALDKAATAQHFVAGQQRTLQDRLGEVARLEAQARSIPVEVDAARAAETAAAAQLEAQRSDKDRREADARHQLNELARGIAFYRRLGLDFEKISDDRLRLVFTAIDAADPERAFSFCVRVTDTDAYEVDDCEPRLAELPALLHVLNESNDFSRFVQSMRRAFKDACL